MNFTAIKTQPECLSSPQVVIEGETETPTISYWDTVSATNGTMVAYRGTQDKSATVLSGNLAASGNTLTCKVIGAEVGGYTYRYYVKVTLGGNVVIRFFDRQVLKKSSPKTSYK
jgi:hypothetical protein